MKFQSMCQLGLQSSDGLSGDGGSTFKVAHICSWQGNVGYFEATALCHEDVSTDYLSVLLAWQLASCRASELRRELGRHDNI